MNDPKINDYVRFGPKYERGLVVKLVRYGQIEGTCGLNVGIHNEVYAVTELRTGASWHLFRKEFKIVSREEAIAAQVMEEL